MGSTHGALGVPGGLRDHGGHVLPNDLGGHAADRCNGPGADLGVVRVVRSNPLN